MSFITSFEYSNVNAKTSAARQSRRRRLLSSTSLVAALLPAALALAPDTAWANDYFASDELSFLTAVTNANTNPGLHKITLTANVVVTNLVNLSSKGLVIDLDKHTLSGPAGPFLQSNTAVGEIITIEDGHIGRGDIEVVQGKLSFTATSGDALTVDANATLSFGGSARMITVVNNTGLLEITANSNVQTIVANGPIDLKNDSTLKLRFMSNVAELKGQGTISAPSLTVSDGTIHEGVTVNTPTLTKFNVTVEDKAVINAGLTVGTDKMVTINSQDQAGGIEVVVDPSPPNNTNDTATIEVTTVKGDVDGNGSEDGAIDTTADGVLTEALDGATTINIGADVTSDENAVDATSRKGDITIKITDGATVTSTNDAKDTITTAGGRNVRIEVLNGKVTRSTSPNDVSKTINASGAGNIEVVIGKDGSVDGGATTLQAILVYGHKDHNVMLQNDGSVASANGSGASLVAFGSGTATFEGSGSLTAEDVGLEFNAEKGNATMKGTGNIAGAFGVDMTSIDGGDLIVSNAQGTTTIGTIEGKTNSGLKMSSQGTGAGDIVINRTGGTIKGKTYGADVSAAKTQLAGLPYTGNVTVKFDGTMEGATDDALRALTDLGNIDIEGSGTFIGVSSGINAHSDGGNVKIHLYKAANVTANGASSSAVHALQTDTTDGVDMEVINEGTLRNTGSGGGTTYGINAANFAKSANADTADIHVVNNGQIEVSGDNAFAIRASANQGNVVVDGNGSVKVTGTGLTRGIYAESTKGNVSVVAGAITLAAKSSGRALGAFASDGNVSVTSNGKVDGGAVGVVGESDTGSVTLTVNGAVGGTVAPSGNAVWLISETTGKVAVNNSLTAGNDGVNAKSNGGDLEVTQSSASKIKADNVGIRTATVLLGTTLVKAAGTVDGLIFGIRTGAEDGSTRIELDGGKVTSAGDAIRAEATGTGSVTVTGQGDVTGGADAGDDGIDVRVTSGNVLIDTTGTISGDPGVVATATTGGPIELSGRGNVVGTGAEAVRLATSNGNGNIKLARNGNLTGATDGASLTTSGANGTGTGTIDVAVFFGTTTSGGNGAGLKTRAELGRTAVSSAGGIVGTTFGIDAQSTGGALDVALQNGAFVRATSGTGINLVSASAPATVKLAAGSRVGGATALSANTKTLVVDNAGSLGQPGTTTALRLASGTVAFHNLKGGQVFGSLETAAGSGGIALDKQAGSAWQLADSAALDLKGQNDTLDNAGLFAAGSGVGSLSGLERLVNLPGGVFAVNPAGGAPAAFTVNTLMENNGGRIDLSNTAAPGRSSPTR